MAFDAGDAFAIDKSAGTPCPHLKGHACSVHDDLEKKGFSGCIRYQCAGAGQRTLALYNGQSWRDTAALLPAQSETFRHLRKLHDLIQLLETAHILPLPPDVEARRMALVSDLCPPDMTPTLAETLATGSLPGRVKEFLKSLAQFAPENPVSKT